MRPYRVIRRTQDLINLRESRKVIATYRTEIDAAARVSQEANWGDSEEFVDHYWERR